MLKLACDILEHGYEAITEPLHRRWPAAGDLIEFGICVAALPTIGLAAVVFTKEGRECAKRIITFG